MMEDISRVPRDDWRIRQSQTADFRRIFRSRKLGDHSTEATVRGMFFDR